LGICHGIIKKSGSWYTYNNKNIGQGLNNVKKYFIENSELLNKIEKEIFKLIDNENK